MKHPHLLFVETRRIGCEERADSIPIRQLAGESPSQICSELGDLRYLLDDGMRSDGAHAPVPNPVCNDEPPDRRLGRRQLVDARYEVVGRAVAPASRCYGVEDLVDDGFLQPGFVDLLGEAVEFDGAVIGEGGGFLVVEICDGGVFDLASVDVGEVVLDDLGVVFW